MVLVGVLIAYGALAYAILPALWRHHEREPGLASLPMVTRTASGIPGDALNVGLVGNKDDVLRAMHAAGWFPADPITLRTSIEIIGSVVLDRPYHDAPVARFSTKGKSRNWRSRSPMAGARTGGTTSGSGRSLTRGRMAVRSGLVQSPSTAGSV